LRRGPFFTPADKCNRPPRFLFFFFGGLGRVVFFYNDSRPNPPQPYILSLSSTSGRFALLAAAPLNYFWLVVPFSAALPMSLCPKVEKLRFFFLSSATHPPFCFFWDRGFLRSNYRAGVSPRFLTPSLNHVRFTPARLELPLRRSLQSLGVSPRQALGFFGSPPFGPF